MAFKIAQISLQAQVGINPQRADLLIVNGKIWDFDVRPTPVTSASRPDPNRIKRSPCGRFTEYGVGRAETANMRIKKPAPFEIDKDGYPELPPGRDYSIATARDRARWRFGDESMDDFAEILECTIS